MLNMISNIESAMLPRPRFGMGACMPALAPATASASTCAAATARPRTQKAADLVGRHHALAAAGQAAGQQLTGKQSTYMTRIGAVGDGAPGSHPAREPV